MSDQRKTSSRYASNNSPSRPSAPTTSRPSSREARPTSRNIRPSSRPSSKPRAKTPQDDDSLLTALPTPISIQAPSARSRPSSRVSSATRRLSSPAAPAPSLASLPASQRRRPPPPPGYDWHIGGRMKELRTRFLARKFLFLWRRRVFGRMTPSEADEFYRRKIVRRCAQGELFCRGLLIDS